MGIFIYMVIHVILGLVAVHWYNKCAMNTGYFDGVNKFLLFLAGPIGVWVVLQNSYDLKIWPWD